MVLVLVRWISNGRLIHRIQLAQKDRGGIQLEQWEQVIVWMRVNVYALAACLMIYAILLTDLVHMVKREVWTAILILIVDHVTDVMLEGVCHGRKHMLLQDVMMMVEVVEVVEGLLTLPVQWTRQEHQAEVFNGKRINNRRLMESIRR
jgi:hypothetical protein